MRRVTRASEIVQELERMGAPIGLALEESTLRAAGGCSPEAALMSVAQDYAQGHWPAESGEVVGESWAKCAFCDDDFLPDGPDELYCSQICELDDTATCEACGDEH